MAEVQVDVNFDIHDGFWAPDFGGIKQGSGSTVMGPATTSGKVYGWFQFQIPMTTGDTMYDINFPSVFSFFSQLSFWTAADAQNPDVEATFGVFMHASFEEFNFTASPPLVPGPFPGTGTDGNVMDIDTPRQVEVGRRSVTQAELRILAPNDAGGFIDIPVDLTLLPKPQELFGPFMNFRGPEETTDVKEFFNFHVQMIETSPPGVPFPDAAACTVGTGGGPTATKLTLDTVSAITGKDGSWLSKKESRVDRCPKCGTITPRELWVMDGWSKRLVCQSCHDPRDVDDETRSARPEPNTSKGD